MRPDGLPRTLIAALLTASVAGGCADRPSDASSTAWSAATGASMTEPSDTGDVGPRRTEALSQAQQLWAAAGPDTYSYSVDLNRHSTSSSTCGHGLLWVVVERGNVTSARDVERHCDVPPGLAPTAEDLFDLVSQQLPAAHAGTAYDTTTGLPRSFSAGDGAAGTRVDLEVVALHPGAALPVTSELDQALDAARQRWSTARPDAYLVQVSTAAMIGEGTVESVVADGQPVRTHMIAGEPAADITPRTVEQALDRIAVAGGASEVVLDPTTGVPLHAWLDPRTDIIDDEWTLTVAHPVVLTPTQLDEALPAPQPNGEPRAAEPTSEGS